MRDINLKISIKKQSKKKSRGTNVLKLCKVTTGTERDEKSIACKITNKKYFKEILKYLPNPITILVIHQVVELIGSI